MTSELEQYPAPPGEPPEEPPPPDIAEGPRWPVWFAPAAFLAALIAVFLVAAVAQVIVAATGNDFPTSGPGIELGGTLVQDALLVLAAVYFASRVAKPTLWQFGLRPTPLRRALRGIAYAYATFWVFSAFYTLIFHPHGKQTVAKDLGADNGGVLLVLAAVLVIVVAPVCEEIFFRGFFYRALRSRFMPLAAAAIDGVVFGAIHYTGAQTLAVLPPLAVLGFVFCMLYQYTGSLFPTIALHAANNSISYAVTVKASTGVAVALGVAMLAACAIVPRYLPQQQRAPALQ